MSRKLELQEELKKIHQKEVEKELSNYDKAIKDRFDITEDKVKLAEIGMKKKMALGDFIIKLSVALGVSASFFYIVVTGHEMPIVDAIEYMPANKSSNKFSILSVVGPLFGMVLQYYFGKRQPDKMAK